MKRTTLILVLSFLFTAVFFFQPALAAKAKNWRVQVRTLAKNGSVLVTDGNGKTVYSLNPEKKLMPASTLKIVTCAAALDALGPDYRFITEFRRSKDGDLYVVGRGDPFLISEELAEIARTLRAKGLTRVKHIFLDNSFFQPGLVLDGTSRSLKPYDAYNGALCVNFNTINARIDKNGRVESAEPQTPLTEMARDLAVQSGKKGEIRFNLADSPEVGLLYAGDLIKTFLNMAGVDVTGEIRPAAKDPQKIPLFYRHQSTKSLAWLIGQLMEYSNNFMTNQIFLTMGAEKSGPPANPDKARAVVAEFLRKKGVHPFHVEEGSGLSRKNQITAVQMQSVLKVFKPYRNLLTRRGKSWIKTGTLRDVNSMVGYMEPDTGEPLTFVILLNGTYRYNTRERIHDLLEENLF